MLIIDIAPFRALGFKTIKELATECGYTEGALRNWVQRGHMTAIRLEGNWYSLPHEAQRCAEARGLQGRLKPWEQASDEESVTELVEA